MTGTLANLDSEVNKAFKSHGKQSFRVYKNLNAEALNVQIDGEVEEDAEEEIRVSTVDYINLKLRNFHKPISKLKSKKRREELKKQMTKLSKNPFVKKLGLTWIAGQYHPRVMEKVSKTFQTAQEYSDLTDGINQDAVEKYAQRDDELTNMEGAWEEAAKNIGEFVDKKKSLNEVLEELEELPEIESE